MQGHIRKRLHTTKQGKETTTWYVVFDNGRDENGKRKQQWLGGFSTRKEAEAARAKTINDINRGGYLAPTKTTLSEWLNEHWLPMMRTQVKKSTWSSYQRNVALHIVPRIGDKPLKDVTAQVLNRLYDYLLTDGKKNAEGGLSPKTVRYIHTIIHKAISDAMDADLLAINTADRAKPPRPRASATDKLNFWKADELASFLKHVEGTRLEAAWHVAALTGMRRGEVLGLRWQDIDFETNRLAVRNTLVSVAYEIVESTPKTHRARVIDIDPNTVERLKAHRERQKDERSEWGNDYKDDDRVFPREDGSPLHPDGFTQRFELELKRAGLRRIRLHDLRHTHATIALRAGIPVKVISERLGHETPAFTLKQYAHVIPGMQAEAAILIANLIRDSNNESA
jgi:integrase